MSAINSPTSIGALPAARLGWLLAAVQAVIYGSFVTAFMLDPSAMTRPLAPGMSVTVATVFGLCVVFSTMALVGVYVLIANRIASDRGA